MHNQREVKISMGNEMAPVAGDVPGVLEFVFPATGDSVRTIEVDGDLWFAAADACHPLDLSDYRTSLRTLDEEEVLRHTMPGSDILEDFVSESGMYSLILRSRKPEAKQFKRWLTREVIPSIRKTGSYSSKPKSNIDMLVETALEMQRVEKQQIELDRQQRELEKQQIETRLKVLEQAARIDHQQQAIERHDAQLDSLNHKDGCLTILAWWKQRGVTELLTNSLAAQLGKRVTAVYRQRFGKEPYQTPDGKFGFVNQYPETLLDELLGAFIS